jgi:hypothetical protein
MSDDRDLLLMQLSAMDAEVDRLRAENDRLRAELRDRDRIIKQAKDADPVQRPSLSRVRRLAESAFMWVAKVPSSRGKGKGFDWLLTFGRPVGFDLRYVVRSRRFRSLRQIWDILSEDFCLNDLFDSYLKKTGRPKPVSRQKRCGRRIPWSYDDLPLEQQQLQILEDLDVFLSQTWDSG